VTGQLIIKNNLLMDNLLGMGIYSLSTSENIEVYNNTISRHYFGIHMETGSAGWVIKNNIIVQDIAWDSDTSHVCLQLNGGDSDIGTNTWDNNLYYFKNGGGTNNPIRSNSTTYSLATWQGKTGSPDASGQMADPLFVTAYSDLHLQVSSPAIDGGVDVTGVTTDYDGVTLASPPDCGALQKV
jgi:parallel beta-helix repeat protein